LLAYVNRPAAFERFKSGGIDRSVISIYGDISKMHIKPINC